MESIQERPRWLAGAEPAREYERLVNDFQSHLSRQGIAKRAFSPGGLQAFQACSLSQQESFVRQLRSYLDICLGLEEMGLSALRCTRNTLAAVGLRLRVTIPGEFVEALGDEDIVEIFDYEGNQLYRNLSFFEISDYTIDDFFGRTWDYLYERSSVVTRQIFEKVARTATERKCIPFGVPEHYMRERATEKRKIVKVSLKYLAPLLHGERAVAWIASSTASEVVGQTDPAVEGVQFI